MSLILAINAGSSSIKYAVFDGAQEVLRGAVEEVRDHGAALTRVLAELEEGGVAPSGLAAVAHRVVHGGMERAEALRVDEAVLAVIRDAVPLAPLHNPANLAAIEAFMALAPDVPQVACFDTAFHATIPDVAARYALPPEAEALGLRRYGFHGISYSSLTARMPEIAGALPRRLLACHLGNGASLAAILDGRSVATTMGYSPLDGLTMGTRSGSIDGNAVLKIAEEFGIDGAGVMLNKHSGLLGLSGISSDMRVLRASDDARAAFAIDHFLNALVTHAGAMIAANSCTFARSPLRLLTTVGSTRTDRPRRLSLWSFAISRASIRPRMRASSCALRRTLKPVALATATMAMTVAILNRRVVWVASSRGTTRANVVALATMPSSACAHSRQSEKTSGSVLNGAASAG